MSNKQSSACANNKVYDYRKKRGYTQVVLAERISVTRQTIGLIENEDYNPSLRICKELSKVLRASLDELFPEA